MEEAPGEAPVVYGCNIDFIQLIGEENYILNYPDGSARCQRQELLGPGSERGCDAGGPAGSWGVQTAAQQRHLTFRAQRQLQITKLLKPPR